MSIEKERQNIPRDIDPNDPNVIPILVEITKQVLRRITELQNEVTKINNRVFK